MRIAVMSLYWSRILTPAAVLLIVGGIECGRRAERSLHIGAYYRELALEQREMNPLERALASVLLAAGEKHPKHKT